MPVLNGLTERSHPCQIVADLLTIVERGKALPGLKLAWLGDGNNVLAFSASIDWDIQRIQARGAAMTGGLYNVTLRGSGYVAITTKGEPVALDVASAPTFGDAQAVVMWTGGVRMDIKVDTGGMKSMLRGGTGKTFQMAFGGQGYVLVQPAESVTDGGHQSSGGSSGGLSDLLGG